MRTLAVLLLLVRCGGSIPLHAQTVSAPAQNAPVSGPFRLTDHINSALPAWLKFGLDERVRLEGFFGSGFQPSSSDDYLLSRLRPEMSLLPATWLEFKFQCQDSRVFWKKQKPYAPPFQDTFDLRQAYAQGGDLERRHFRLKVGRQEINLGEERLVGSSGWGNTARSFDAVRLTLQKGRYRLDAFAASPVVLHDGEVGEHVPANNLHGVYGSLDQLVPASKLEPFLLWRLARSQKTETGRLGNLDFTTAGVRWVGRTPGKLEYSVEVARQQGSLATERIAAWAGHWAVSRPLPLSWNVRALGEYNYASGDRRAGDGRRSAFEQLFGSAHEKYGMADQIGWRNIHHGRAGMEMKPHRRWTMSAKYGMYWLADSHDALYNSAGTAVVRKADGSAGRFVGTGLDGSTVYSHSRQLQVGCGVGRLIPGTFLKRATPGRAYTYPYLMLNISL